MQRYISVPVAGTYEVYVYALNAAGDGTNPLCEHAWKGAPYPYYASVTTSSPYTVTYHNNGGGGAPSAMTKSYGINLTLSSTQPTRSGYQFTGWNTAADGSGTTYSPGATYTANADLTLYAQWTKTSVSYRTYNTGTKAYETLMANNWTEVTSSTTTLGAAGNETWYLVNSNVTVNSSRIEVLGTVHLILADGYSLRAEKGLHVPPGVTLNIYGQSGGTGQLYGFSNTNYIAGIGGDSGEASGTVNIHGGTIQAWGADNSAGIGGGTGGNGGTTTIYGGSVNSTGVEGGAGIGGGYGGNGGIITIYGGDVVARGSYKWGAGIGGGRDGNGGTISIYGGTINATGGEAAAGIGGGVAANCGTITITGGTVVAQAQTAYADDNSQAIGSGAGTGISGGNLNIYGVKVYSSANAANPVAPANYLSTCQSKYAKLMPCTHNYEDGVCTICGGTELIGTGGPGTYLAYQTATHSFVELTADNPTFVDASTTTMGAAGTETWYIVNNDVTVSSRITVNGTVHLILNDGMTLTANGGIDVTEGKSLHIHSQRERTGCLIATATDGAGIGGGSVGNITIHSGTITATGGAWSAGIGGGTNGGGGSITIYRGNVEGIGWRDNNRGDAVGIGHGSSGAAVAIQAERLRLQYYYNGWQDATYSQRASALGYAHVRFFPCTEHSYSNGRCTHCGKYQWYTVTYNGNGSTGGSVPTDNTHYTNNDTGTVTVLGNTGNLVRTGYTFIGWNTQADVLGTDYAPGATFTISDNTTLYAKWEVNKLELANNADNGNDISTATGDGMYYDVTLAGRTLYKDGDWNTLCLPFALASLTGTPLEGATVKTLESSSFSNGTLTMTFSDNQTSIAAGKPYIVKYDADLVILSTADWNTFATKVNNGTESYAGKTVKLAADISVSTMVGTVFGSTQGRAFCGTFDGCGHTLNVSISDTDNQGTAPFRYISGATIKNLKTTGTVTGNLHCTGLVGFAANSTTNIIQNCEVAVSVVCSGGGHSHCGGILGHGLNSTTTIRDCLFSGTISGTTTATGIIYGWGDVSGTHTIVNCLANGTYTNSNGIDLLKKAGGTEVITNCYKKQNIGSQGTYTTATGETLRFALGNGWEVSGDNLVPKMAADIVNPVFSGVTISSSTANVETEYVDFVGTYSPVTYADENRSVLFLGGGSKLYYPDGTKTTTIGACRAYFQLKGITAGDPVNGVKAFVLNFGEDDADGIIAIDNGQLTIDNEGSWYDLGGRKLNGRPTKGGIYIHNGKKVLY